MQFDEFKEAFIPFETVMILERGIFFRNFLNECSRNFLKYIG